MCFRCIIFSLSGDCELLFLLCFTAAWTREVVSVMLYPCMFCVALSMDLLVLCVACLTRCVNCLGELFGGSKMNIYIYIYIYIIYNYQNGISLNSCDLLNNYCIGFLVCCSKVLAFTNLNPSIFLLVLDHCRQTTIVCVWN